MDDQFGGGLADGSGAGARLGVVGVAQHQRDSSPPVVLRALEQRKRQQQINARANAAITSTRRGRPVCRLTRCR
ncbi:MAG TPA: hypothetical protein VFS86_04255 [Rhodanobacteraceae bacterium]|nr:hypothetical protein [Rhodanobacteraceae bacterium]